MVSATSLQRQHVMHKTPSTNSTSFFHRIAVVLMVPLRVSRNVLTSCYRYAALFVYPSLHEGFGIPTLGAMLLDGMASCSRTSVVREVFGKTANFFDLNIIDNIRDVMEITLTSPTEARTMITWGQSNKARFSWHLCAEDTIRIHRHILIP